MPPIASRFARVLVWLVKVAPSTTPTGDGAARRKNVRWHNTVLNRSSDNRASKSREARYLIGEGKIWRKWRWSGAVIARLDAWRRHRTTAFIACSRNSPRLAFTPSQRFTTRNSRTRSAISSWRWTACWYGSIRLHEGKTRAVLDPLLRDVAARGPWVSAHPDVILKMGVKEVLAPHEASRMGDRYAPVPFRAGVPSRQFRSGCERPARAC